MTTQATPAEASDAQAGRPSPAPVPPGRRRKKVDDTSEGMRAGPVWAIVAWALALLFFFPVVWMVLTSLPHARPTPRSNPPVVLRAADRRALRAGCSTATSRRSCSTR